MKSNSYLIFAMVFLLSMLDQILVSFDSDMFFLDILISLSFVLINLILIQLASEMVNHKLPVSTKIWQIFGILTFLFLFILKYLLFQNTISQDYFTLKFLIGDPLRIVAGAALIYGTSRSNIIVKSRRTLFIKKGWISTGIIIFISGIIQFGIYSLDLFYDLTVNGENSPIPISVADSLSLLGILVLGVFTSIIAIFYPEAMLLSHTQILKAAKLYDLISKVKTTDTEMLSKLIFRIEAPEFLIEYIKSLPKDVLDELNKSAASSNEKS